MKYLIFEYYGEMYLPCKYFISGYLESKYSLRISITLCRIYSCSARFTGTNSEDDFTISQDDSFNIIFAILVNLKPNPTVEKDISSYACQQIPYQIRQFTRIKLTSLNE